VDGEHARALSLSLECIPHALHGRMIFVLCPEPYLRPAGPIRKINALADDAFIAEPTSVLENPRAVAGQVLHVLDALGSADQLQEPLFTIGKRLAAEVLTVKFQ
jgi:hypothetical protein